MTWNSGREISNDVTREELHEEVWTDPVQVVARRYGISDKGLAKICLRCKIPIPPRGHWAKKQAGRPVKTTPLPKWTDKYPCYVRLRKKSESERQLMDERHVLLKKLHEENREWQVPDELLAPHPLVKRTGKLLRQHRSLNKETQLRSNPGEALDIQVSRRHLDRALRLMDTLIKGVIANGFELRIDEATDKTIIERDGIGLTLSLNEGYTRSRHERTRSEKKHWMTIGNTVSD